MKEIKLSLRLTLPEYDTLVECVADELHRAEVFAGKGGALFTTCSGLLEKIKAARRASATCASCLYCEACHDRQVATGNADLALCHVVEGSPSVAYLSGPACKHYFPNPAIYD